MFEDEVVGGVDGDVMKDVTGREGREMSDKMLFFFRMRMWRTISTVLLSQGGCQISSVYRLSMLTCLPSYLSMRALWRRLRLWHCVRMDGKVAVAMLLVWFLPLVHRFLRAAPANIPLPVLCDWHNDINLS